MTTASPRQAAEALEEVARLRRVTRRSLGRPWLPLVLFGSLTMLSGLVILAADTAALPWLWFGAGAGALLVIRRHYRRRARRSGVTGRSRGAWVIGMAIFLGCLAAGFVGGAVAGPSVAVLAPMLVALLGYVILAAVQRDPAPAGAMAVGVAVAAAAALLGAGPALVEIAFGACVVAAGAGLRLGESAGGPR